MKVSIEFTTNKNLKKYTVYSLASFSGWFAPITLIENHLAKQTSQETALALS